MAQDADACIVPRQTLRLGHYAIARRRFGATEILPLNSDWFQRLLNQLRNMP